MSVSAKVYSAIAAALVESSSDCHSTEALCVGVGQ
jgi:hypothetical protein